jgi:hypothetical protein
MVVKHFGARLKRSRSFWFGQLRPARSFGTDDSEDQPDVEYLVDRRSDADLKKRRLSCIPSPPSANPIGNTPINRGRYNGKWDLKPVLRSEPHPLFLQPVKDYRIRRSKSKPECLLRASARATFMPPASAPDTKGTNRSSMSSPSRTPSTPGMFSAISSNSTLRPAPFENARRVPAATPVSRMSTDDPSDLMATMDDLSEHDSVSIGGTPPDSPSKLITALEYLSELRRSSEGEVASNAPDKGKERRRSVIK